MSETPQATGPARVPPQARRQASDRPNALSDEGRRVPPEELSGSSWIGWITFAAIMLVMMGSFHAIMGLTALFQSGFYLVGSEGLLVNVDFTAWGWTHLVLGALAVGAAFGVLVGQTWARVSGIALALLSALVNLVFIAAYPLWSIMVIALDVLVIYAIAVHGKDAKALA